MFQGLPCTLANSTPRPLVTSHLSCSGALLAVPPVLYSTCSLWLGYSSQDKVPKLPQARLPTTENPESSHFSILYILPQTEYNWFGNKGMPGFVVHKIKPLQSFMMYFPKSANDGVQVVTLWGRLHIPVRESIYLHTLTCRIVFLGWLSNIKRVFARNKDTYSGRVWSAKIIS